MLRVRDLSCMRGGREVLRGVGFTLAPGEALILTGPNGVGKTTLLRTLAGLQPPLSGEIEGAAEAAFASHADGVKAQLSVTENLRFWADLHGVAFAPAVLGAFALQGLAGRLAGTLSAGQRRRLGLARLAVIARPLVLLDEPTVSLDTASVALFLRWLSGTHLAGGGMAVIATHLDLGLAAPELALSAHVPPKGAARGLASDEAFL